jgi:hypothetical protein
MNWQRYGRKKSQPSFRYNPTVTYEGQKKTVENFIIAQIWPVLLTQDFNCGGLRSKQNHVSN